jgi:hypothetical protein
MHDWCVQVLGKRAWFYRLYCTTGKLDKSSHSLTSGAESAAEHGGPSGAAWTETV